MSFRNPRKADLEAARVKVLRQYAGHHSSCPECYAVWTEVRDLFGDELAPREATRVREADLEEKAALADKLGATLEALNRRVETEFIPAISERDRYHAAFLDIEAIMHQWKGMSQADLVAAVVERALHGRA